LHVTKARSFQTHLRFRLMGWLLHPASTFVFFFGSSCDELFKERKGAPFCGGSALLFCFVVKRI
jgi:hypothetical protein